VQHRKRRLSTQIFLAQLAILIASTTIGFLLVTRAEHQHLDYYFENRAASIAQTVAGVPLVKSCMARPSASCNESLQRFATTTEHQTDASYVVLIDMNRVRHTHPNPREVGKKVIEPIETVDGRVHLRTDNGSTGYSANALAPLYGPDGRMVGEVSVGIRESSVWSALWHALPSYALWFALALAIGALASWVLARRLRRRTFGLELDEIASLLQEREATLHGIREGVVAVNPTGRISVMNDEAQRLLGLPLTATGRQLDELLPPGPLRDVLSGQDAIKDDLVLTDDHFLVINRMPITLNGRPHGNVVTLRDRTEVAGLLRELDGVRSLTDSLRAQQHEFANRMHALAGLLELGRADDALNYLVEIRGTEAQFDETLRTRIAAPQVVGLLLGKAAEASERSVDLVIAPETSLGAAPGKVQALTTILGNLIDNAFDAVARVPAPRRVVVSVVETPSLLTITVSDNGPGIEPGAAQMIFSERYTTNPSSDGQSRGLGLPLVDRLVRRLRGTVRVSEGPGARFEVSLPTEVTLASVTRADGASAE
jgi:two-component system, CitB family, sensor kinase